MQVGLDITSLIYGRGVSRYTSNLLSSLATLPDLDLALYATTKHGRSELDAALSVSLASLDVAQREKILQNMAVQNHSIKWQKFLWNTLGTNKLKKLMPAVEVFHTWDYLQPPDKNLPLVSTIHDLAILKYPDTVHPDIWQAHHKSWQVLKDRGAQIITVSQSSKNDILELLDFPEAQVTVIYEALTRETRRVAENMTADAYEEIKTALGQEKPFVLFVGTREPRKNLSRLINAWKSISNDFDLLIVGSEGWDKNVIKQWPGLKFLGKASDEVLAVLYHEAAALAYPSLDEGFGLPILEAFYFNLPVVTSDLSAMKEIAGEAAFLVDPTSTESIKNGLIAAVSMTTDEKVALGHKMSARLQDFSWDTAAAQTMKVYQKALAYA